MVEAGYEKAGVQCRDMLKNLKSKYKEVKDNKSEAGR